MNLLAIDTSTERASVALAIKNNPLLYEEQSEQRQHALCLLPMIERLLKQVDLKINQLDGIAFGRGPGSFTGLRIACALAKGLAYPHQTPLFPVSSLAAIANEVLDQQPELNSSTILTLLDARMNQLYWSHFRENNQASIEQVSDAADIAFSCNSLIIAGVGYQPYLNQLPATIRAAIHDHFIAYPNAKAMIRLVHSGKIAAVNTEQAAPVYIRNQVTQGEACG